MPSTAFKQADIRRAVKAALDAGYPVKAIEIELPNGVKFRLLPEALDPSEDTRVPDAW